MVNKTAEIRWWSSEKTEMWNWFEKNVWKGFDGRPDERIDYYLETLDEGMGVKWREGNLEFKFRKSKCDLGVGTMEAYVKESLTSELTQEILPTHEMVAVVKKRYKRVAQPGRGFIQDGHTTTEGCQIEYTEVKFGESRTLYTIGFEAFSKKGGEVDVLKETLGSFPLTEGDFSMRNSAGYAAKIKELTLKKVSSDKFLKEY